MTETSCLRCHHKDSIEAGELTTEEVMRSGVFKCTKCKARMAYGHLVPRMVVNREDKWVTLSIDGVKYKMDRDFVVDLCANLLSVSKA